MVESSNNSTIDFHQHKDLNHINPQQTVQTAPAINNICYHDTSYTIRTYNSSADHITNLIDITYNRMVYRTIVQLCVLSWYSIAAVPIGILAYYLLHKYFTQTIFPISHLHISILCGVCTTIPQIYNTLEYYRSYTHNTLFNYINHQPSDRQQHKLVITNNNNDNAVLGILIESTINSGTVQYSHMVIDCSHTHIVESLHKFYVQRANELKRYRIMIISNNINTPFNQQLIHNKYILKRISTLPTQNMKLLIYDQFIDIPSTYTATTYYTDSTIIIRDFIPIDQPQVNHIFIVGMKSLGTPMSKITIQRSPVLYYYIAGALLLLGQPILYQYSNILSYIAPLQYNVTIILVLCILVVGQCYYGYQYGLMAYVYASLGMYEDTPLTDLQDTYLYYTQKANSTMLVAQLANHDSNQLSNKIVGMVSIDNRGENICELRRMSVLPQYKKLRIGSKLCHTLIEYAKSNGYHTIKLGTSEAQNPAIKLYHKFGWRTKDTILFNNGVKGLNMVYEINNTHHTKSSQHKSDE